jgi:hypothetical protein
LSEINAASGVAPKFPESPIVDCFAQEGFMKVHPGDAIIGLMMIGFAVLGISLALHALDLEMSVFGVSLAAFAALFVAGQIRRQFVASTQRTSTESRHG